METFNTIPWGLSLIFGYLLIKNWKGKESMIAIATVIIFGSIISLAGFMPDKITMITENFGSTIGNIAAIVATVIIFAGAYAFALAVINDFSTTAISTVMFAINYWFINTGLTTGEWNPLIVNTALLLIGMFMRYFYTKELENLLWYHDLV